MLVSVSSPAPRCLCNGCEQWRQARIHHPQKYKNVEQWTANVKVFRCFFVTDNKGENYKTTNNTNAWPIGSHYCPASPMTEDNGLAPPPCLGVAVVGRNAKPHHLLSTVIVILILMMTAHTSISHQSVMFFHWWY
jgi:hypothetical protein